MKMKLILITLTLTALFSGTAINCNTTEPPVNGALTLSLADVSCTEAWIELETNGLTLPANISLLDENDVVQNITLSNSSTTIYIDSLLPNKTYNIQAFIPQGGGHSSNLPETKSNKLSITTLDTTSHNFTWQTWTFGDAGAGGSSLYDIAIIDENDIWAVGVIYMNGSTGKPDPNAYNAAHWDGSRWELKRIKTNACGGVVYPPIKSIFAFSSDDILFAHTDGSISHYNGIEFTNDCSLITQLNGSVNNIWGVSKNDFYVVSDNGFIGYYKLGHWSKIESGTDWNIYDIYGYTNTINSQQEILCASTAPNIYTNSALIKITGQANIEQINLTTNRLAGSVWTNIGFPIYVCGDGLFVNKNGKWEEIKLPVNYVTSKICGNGLNDIFLCGVLGLIAHFNGHGWDVFSNVYNATYTSVYVKENVVSVVGWRNGKGVITLGKRN